MEQHFLTNPDKLRLLVRAASVTPETRVIELGAGGGTVAAALPPCTLTLVELDERLAIGLKKMFLDADVLNKDALDVLEQCEFDVLLSNLPYALTAGVIERLHHKVFQRALVAVHEDTKLEHSDTLMLEPFLTLNETDFSPAQPFKSKVILITPKLDL